MVPATNVQSPSGSRGETVTFLLALHLLAALPQTQDTGRVAGWRSDLQVLLEAARRFHAGPTRPAHQPAFAAAISRLSAEVSRLSDERIVVEIQRVMALLGDGHSLVYIMPTPRIPLAVLPFDFYWFSDGLYVVRGHGEYERLSGSRVTRLGGRPVEDLLRELQPFISRDNAMAFKTFGPVYLTFPMFLDALGVPNRAGRFDVTLADSVGRERTLTISPGPWRRHPRKLGPPPRSARAGPPPPMYLERYEMPYWMRRMDRQQTVYVQFNQVMDADGETLAAFARRLADTLAGSVTRNVIVDVRHNNGGNNGLLAPLIESLAAFERAREGNRIFVVTSRATFSAAQNFITRLERVAHPEFAGEPSMSSPNFTGEDNEVLLPWSGVRVSISNRYWQDSRPDDRRPWIEMRYPVALSAADYFANRDPVLPVVLRAIEP
jgi:hypothetical protein